MNRDLLVGAFLLVAATGCGAAASGAEEESGSVVQEISALGSPVVRNGWLCQANEMLLGLDTSVIGGKVACQTTTFAAGSSNYQSDRNGNGEAVCSGEPGSAYAIAVGWQPLGPDAAHPTRKVGIICRTLAVNAAGYDNTYAKFTTTYADLQTPSHKTTTFYYGSDEVSVCTNPANIKTGYGSGWALRGYSVKSISGVGLTGFYNCSH